MADKIVIRDSTLPGVFRDGPAMGAGGKIPLSSLDPTGASNGEVVTLVAGVWNFSSVSSIDTASNLGLGSRVFKSKVGNDFQFRTLVGGTNVTINQNADDLTINAATATGLLTLFFASAAQTITTNGSLTIPHGLGTKPLIMSPYIKNINAELGYNVGDEVFVDPSETGLYGMSIRRDAVNILVKFINSSVFSVVDQGTGAATSITHANWELYFNCWA